MIRVINLKKKHRHFSGDELRTKRLKIRQSEYTVDKLANQKRENIHQFFTLLPKAQRYHACREAGVGWPTPAFPQPCSSFNMMVPLF